ncbi:HGGxSTG domain-containing protein [Vibrio tapetis]|uniref:Uncharacterized protein n=1 Tax=Vibrio tapetis subsp. tapetis TaxID=1671868 RepID=A0A2N8ZES4_9VIBR|nr:HGGxSTG domain-containing protein [Vibrio tapetis]SON50414.1 protein of unknown function [Vibrio tapetis subsp. tapetis]
MSDSTHRFNLSTLPLCGAKTRAGGRCKRRGSLKNGRCKLHGGQSTGAKTKEGKLALRANAIKRDIPEWMWNDHFKPDDFVLITHSYNALRDKLTSSPKDWRGALSLIQEHRILFESFKYVITELYDHHALFYIQTALDRHYKASESQHLKCLLYTNAPELGRFNVPISDEKMALFFECKQTKTKPFWE